MRRKNLGNLGENLAVKKLKSDGYKILARNFHSLFGEIDIVALESSTLVFVEVKTRWSDKYGSPEEAITPWKIRRIIKAGEYYRLSHPKTPDSMRLDLVAVELSSESNLKRIEIIKNITQ